MENKQKWPETKAGKSALVGQCSGSGSEKSEEHGDPKGRSSEPSYS